jgi:hypothetical protein
MARPLSSIEHSPDRDLIDDMLDQGASLIELEAQFGFSRHVLARRRASRQAAAAASSSPARPVTASAGSPASRAPAATTPEIVQPVSLDIERPEQIDGLEPTDTDEAANGDPHLHRLRLVNILIASGRSHREIAKAFEKSVSTIERWSAQAKRTKEAAIARLDGVKQIGDALWGILFARSELIKNAQECLRHGDRNGHRRAMEAITRNEVARVALIRELHALGIVVPMREAKLTAQDMVKEISSRYTAAVLREIAETPNEEEQTNE